MPVLLKNRLSEGDFESLLECIRELHAFTDLPALRLWLLDTALPALIPSDWLSYNEVDLLNPANTMSIVKPEFDDTLQKLFPRFREVVHQHPLIIRQLQSANVPVHKISDFLVQEAYHQLDLYQDVYRHLGIEYQIAATLRIEPECVMAFALSRQHEDYSERDRAVLEMLRPHMVVAFNNLTMAAEQRALLDQTALALDTLCSATIIVDLNGRILNHTGPGLQWIGATVPGVLPAKISDWLSVPDREPSLRFALDDSETKIRAVSTSSRQRLLLVLTRDNGRPTLAAKKSSLSRRQEEVAAWICRGKSNAEIAAILGISPRTVDKHVEHLFDKVGVESRLALSLALNQNVAA